MRITLISTYTHPVALGLRYISAELRAAGHDTEIFLMQSRRDTTRPDWSNPALEDLIERLRKSDLIGVSLMTNTFHRACFLTQRLRQAALRAPIIWGGTHPTVAPDESLEIADAICIGEGELPMRELVSRLAEGRDPTDVPGLAFRAEGLFGNRRTIRNPPAPLTDNLDDYPFPDWDLSHQFVPDRAGLRPARPENLRGALDTLRVQTARGCPFHCTFCNNAALQELHRGRGKWVRLRSVDNVLTEIRHLRARFQTIRAINFVDDLFLVRSVEQLEEFAEKYNRQVGLPLQLDAFPNTVTESKVRILARLPLQLVSMGIESASAATLRDIYQRPTPPARIAQAIELFARYRIPVEYHYIVSNPYEPEQNVIETMRFIADHHRGRAVLRVFPLMFYPGTPLYQRAKADGLIGARDEAAYDCMGTGGLELARHDYLAIWLRLILALRNVGLPSRAAHRLIDFATHRHVRAVLDRRWFGPAAFLAYRLTRKLWRNFIHQPLFKPWKYLRRLMAGHRPHRVLAGQQA
jgi:anaerobic magnesium-protoporphyrin IX monomethyl ester cyclase